MWHLIEHTLKDTLGILPFLFLTYLLMEWLEHRAGAKTAQLLRRSGKIGPLLGGGLGLLPQCGFSASAAGLYAGGVISAGTLLAVFLSTSDEMLPILISHRVAGGRIVAILALKVAIAAVAGFLTDIFFHRRYVGGHHHEHGSHNHDHDHDHHHDHEHDHDHDHERPQTAIHELCESEGCHCDRGIWRSTLMHTLKVFGYILAITFLFTCLIEAVGEERLGGWLSSVPVLGQAVAGLIGLIPNCAASVVITGLYLDGMISTGCMMAGLLVSAGIGVMVLFRVNHRHMKDNVKIVALLYVVGVVAGVALDLLGIVI
jgi:hypothetical protein